jgi:hypothetical protein
MKAGDFCASYIHVPAQWVTAGDYDQHTDTFDAILSNNELYKKGCL